MIRFAERRKIGEQGGGKSYRTLWVLNVSIGLDLRRRDGIVVQDFGRGDMEGYNDANEEPDRKGAESAVQRAAELFGRMRTPQ